MNQTATCPRRLVIASIFKTLICLYFGFRSSKWRVRLSEFLTQDLLTQDLASKSQIIDWQPPLPAASISDCRRQPADLPRAARYLISFARPKAFFRKRMFRRGAVRLFKWLKKAVQQIHQSFHYRYPDRLTGHAICSPIFSVRTSPCELLRAIFSARSSPRAL